MPTSTRYLVSSDKEWPVCAMPKWRLAYWHCPNKQWELVVIWR
jgi:hypothetical protein